MTLKLENDLDILKMYTHTENEAANLRHSKLSAQGQRSRSTCLKLLAFTMVHIPIKLHQFTTNSLVIGQTDALTPPKAVPVRSIAGVQVKMNGVHCDYFPKASFRCVSVCVQTLRP